LPFQLPDWQYADLPISPRRARIAA